MKKETKDLEEYLEAHGDDLVDAPEEDLKLVKFAKADIKARKARASELQKLRRDELKLSQSQLAQAVGANVRTLQSWETGRQEYPKSVEILMSLMNRMPSVRRELLSPAPGKGLIPTSMSRRRRVNPVKRKQISKKRRG
jgi:DNA-binding transcriptional regulator YiaG